MYVVIFDSLRKTSLYQALEAFLIFFLDKLKTCVVPQAAAACSNVMFVVDTQCVLWLMDTMLLKLCISF